MQGKYRKIMVAMKQESEGYRFWKQGNLPPVCYVESYKEKRAVFFHGHNFLPGETYHMILIGNGNDAMEHQDFGPLRASGDGELQCYKVFGGAELESYQFCLLCADQGDGQMEIVYKGRLFQEPPAILEGLCGRSKMIGAFTEGCDETEAVWYRAEELDKLPEGAEKCRPWMEVYGHYIIGRKEQSWFLGVPGRFLQKEQPLREEGIFLLWQPMRGGEAFFDRPDRMTKKQQEEIFGYWIAAIDVETGILQPL